MELFARYFVIAQKIDDLFLINFQEERTNEIVFYMKGADVVMSSIVQYNDWLEEEVDNMAREGFRTLVVAKKSLTPEQYIDFEQRYTAAKLSLVNRSAQVAAVIESLERDMELLCVTGVEDKLQDNVRNTLEQLRNAGLKVSEGKIFQKTNKQIYREIKIIFVL